MDFEVLSDADSVAHRGAAVIAATARDATQQRGQFVMAVSGGHTPWAMLRALAGEQVSWDKLEVFQVDERIAPDGDPARNLSHLCETLLSHAPLHPKQIRAMPVSSANIDEAARDYARILEALAGRSPVLDLAHLGMGPDGHTASLVPDDAVLDVDVMDRVALTRTCQGRRRMTLTYPVLNRSRRILWVITGTEKAAMLERLRAGDKSIPSGRISRDQALILADRAAAGA